MILLYEDFQQLHESGQTAEEIKADTADSTAAERASAACATDGVQIPSPWQK